MGVQRDTSLMHFGSDGVIRIFDTNGKERSGFDMDSLLLRDETEAIRTRLALGTGGGSLLMDDAKGQPRIRLYARERDTFLQLNGKDIDDEIHLWVHPGAPRINVQQKGKLRPVIPGE